MEANTRIATTHHPVPDCTTILNELEGATCFSALDIKAGFNNLPIAEECRNHIGVITQDGLFALERMTFGFNTAPCCFQNAMHRVLQDPIPGRHVPDTSTFLDDVTVPGRRVLAVWRDTLEAMRRLIEAGFPLNAWKLQLLVATLSVLGYILQSSRYQLGLKALRNLFGS